MKDIINEIVYGILIEHKDSWISNQEILDILDGDLLFNIKITPVELRNIIKRLRFGGHHIIANNRGYKHTSNQQELQEYITRRKLELESELNILRKMEGKW